jgi:magnesium-transporting ATPase (P-type)
MFKISAVIFLLCLAQLSFAKPNNPIKVDSTKKQTTQNNTTAGQKQQQNDTSKVNTLSIDTNKIQQQVVPPVVIDTVKKMDSVITEPVSENVLTNTKLFIYILLSAGGLGFFFFIFVLTLFKSFHKKRSTRQSLLLSWNLFFVVSIIWIFIIWGLVAGFWTSSAFMVVMIFLFIISLIMTIIAIKSK